MSITPANTADLEPLAAPSFQETKDARDNLIWQQLEKITVQEAADLWLSTLSQKTCLNYRSGLKKLSSLNLLSPSMSLQAFALLNHESIVDQIKLVPEWTECSRQSRAACYISFTKFLHRRSQGIISKALPNREGHAKTFFRVREKVKTRAMTRAQWTLFLESLTQISLRDSLIAKVVLQGGKRISEVLALQTEQIDWERRKIVFDQLKTKGLKKSTVITYPECVMEQLKAYVADRKGSVFITRSGKPVVLRRLATTFSKAGAIANIPFKVTPHVLRASTVTYLKQQGFQDSDIMKVTGHASSAMVCAYDKTSQETNATEKVQLVT